MTEIRNVKVYDLRECVVASGNAMRLEPEEVTDETFERGLVRVEKLTKLGGGSGHSNFRTGIRVSFDLKYPQYLTKQLQRYHFFDYVSSTSMMHRITKMNFDECCNEWVDESVKSKMSQYVDFYNLMMSSKEKLEFVDVLQSYKRFIGMKSEEVLVDPFHDCFMRIVSTCPMGAELWVHVSTNYEQLATIAKQRKGHKLREDWGAVLDMIRSLPYSDKLIPEAALEESTDLTVKCVDESIVIEPKNNNVNRRVKLVQDYDSCTYVEKDDEIEYDGSNDEDVKEFIESRRGDVHVEKDGDDIKLVTKIGNMTQVDFVCKDSKIVFNRLGYFDIS